MRNTIDLAHYPGLSVAAEGVENQLIRDQLRELQCDEAQGYYMGKPMPAGEFGEWCGRWQARQLLESSGP